MIQTLKLILLLLIGCSNNIFSQENKAENQDSIGWYKIGETIINFEHERNELKILNQDQFTKLKFVVKLAPVELNELVVFYKNGDQQKFEIKERIKSEGYYQVLELNGHERIISSVIFQSNTVPYMRGDKEIRAVIEVWGKNE